MKLKRILTTALVTMALGMLAACGSSHKSKPAGKVVKGPVSGATVSFAGTAETVTTDVNGVYTILSDGAVTTKGGKYFDLATGSAKTAPDMAAEAGASVITPITTVLANLTGDDKTSFMDALAELGVTDPLNDALVTVTAENKEAIKLNEILGAALEDANIKKFATEFATAVNKGDDFSKALTTATTELADVNSSIDFKALTDAVDELEGKELPTVPTDEPTGSTGGATDSPQEK